MRKGIIVELFSSSLYFHLLKLFLLLPRSREQEWEKEIHGFLSTNAAVIEQRGPLYAGIKMWALPLVHLRPYFFPNTLYTYSDFWRWQCIWHLLFLWHTSCGTLLFGYAWDLQAASFICVLLKEFHICWPCKLLCTVSCLTCESILIAFCKFL